MKLTFCLDSGAYSVYNKHVAKTGPKAKGPVADRKNFNYDYYATREFKKLLRKYVDFCRAFDHALEFYVTFDAIQNAKLSYEITKELLEEGIKPLPVIHTMDDPKWVRKYLDLGFDYIGLGGLGQRARTREYFEWAQPIFKGLPKGTRVHGFAMTSFKLLKELPWASVDSTSPFYKSWMGEAMIPPAIRLKGKPTFSYLNAPNLVVFTKRRSTVDRYYPNLGKNEKADIAAYAEQFGWTIAQLADDDDEGHGYFARYMLNLAYFSEMQKRIKADRGHDLRIYQSGWPGALPKIGWSPYIKGMQDHGVREFSFMGTFDEGNRFAFLDLYEFKNSDEDTTVLTTEWRKPKGKGRKKSRPKL